MNRGPAVPRRERDQLEAILTNCVRHGPADQNQEGHPEWRSVLRERVAWVQWVHPRHGARLRDLFDQIDWSAAQRRSVQLIC